MLVIASEEAALRKVRIDVGTKIASHGPVGTETSKLSTEIAECKVPYILSIVSIGTDFVLCGLRHLNFAFFVGSDISDILVPKNRAEDAQVDYGFKVIGCILSADICAQEGIIKRIVRVIIVNSLDSLGLHVSGELEGGIFCLGCFLGKDVRNEKGCSNGRSGGELCKILIHSCTSLVWCSCCVLFFVRSNIEGSFYFVQYFNFMRSYRFLL